MTNGNQQSSSPQYFNIKTNPSFHSLNSVGVSITLSLEPNLFLLFLAVTQQTDILVLYLRFHIGQVVHQLEVHMVARYRKPTLGKLNQIEVSFSHTRSLVVGGCRQWFTDTTVILLASPSWFPQVSLGITSTIKADITEEEAASARFVPLSQKSKIFPRNFPKNLRLHLICKEICHVATLAAGGLQTCIFRFSSLQGKGRQGRMRLGMEVELTNPVSATDRMLIVLKG